MKLDVRVIPNASRTGFDGRRDGEILLRVQAPAADGRANRAARDYLAESFRVRPSAVQLIAGEKSRHKRFEIVGLDARHGQTRLQDLLEAP